ncbi:unnamed protein product [Paramecium octaurelia]|uniref:PI3K/PI4K catalytic domain-containing protein n=1 Tax=Paramecium octaurelia TaxID=43137 RepID=A0A8S1VWT3_PAROT|nr:unnamed protein product [Paramecium octaurelia]
MNYSILKQTFSNSIESEESKLSLIYLVTSNSLGISLDDLITLFPRCCQNFIAEKIVTESLAYKQFLSHFITEDSEGQKVYVLGKDKFLFDYLYKTNTSYLFSKAYKYLLQNTIEIQHLDSFDRTLNPLIIYEKQHQKDTSNPLHFQLNRISNIELLLREGLKKYLFTFTQNKEECYSLIQQEKYYETTKISFSNFEIDQFHIELSNILANFQTSLNQNFSSIYQFLKFLLGCRIIYQLNKQHLRNISVKLICQSFCKQFFDHYLFIYTEFHEYMIKFIQMECDSLTSGILTNSLPNLSITISAYCQFYRINKKILNFDYKKHIKIGDFLDFYFMFDLLYLQFSQVSSIEEYAVIVDYYRLNLKNPYPNVLVREILQNIATSIDECQKPKNLDPFDFISYDVSPQRLMTKLQTFLVERHLYLNNYEWQFFLFETFSDIKANKNLLNDEQFVQKKIKYIQENYEDTKKINQVEHIFINLLPLTSQKSLSDYILLVLTILDHSLFIKLFSLIVYKYYAHSQHTNMKVLEDLQKFLCIPEYNYLLIGIIKLINQWKNEIKNSKDSFHIALDSVKWKYRQIGLVFFRCGSFIESVYYLEKYLAKKNLLFKFDLKKLSHKQQEKLHNTLLYINMAKSHLNSSIPPEQIYSRLNFNFPFNPDSLLEVGNNWYKEQNVAMKMRQKQIPLDVQLYNFRDLNSKGQYLNILDPSRLDKIVISLISDISRYVSQEMSKEQINQSIKYVKLSIALSLKSTSLSKIICQNIIQTSYIIKRLENYWEGIQGKEIRITFVKRFSQQYWMYLNTLVKRSSKQYKIINYREQYAKHLMKIDKYEEALAICKKKQNLIQCRIYERMGYYYKAISLTGIDPFTYSQNKGFFITDIQNCSQKIKFLRYLIKDQLFHRERVLQTYSDIWSSKHLPPLSRYFENKKKFSKFCYHYAQELEQEYKCKCDSQNQQNCLKLMDLFLSSVSAGDKYVQQSFPKIFRLWFMHKSKDQFAQKFDSYLNTISCIKLQYCLELLITGVETFKNDRTSSRSLAQALSILASNYPSQMIWWLAPLKNFNQTSQHKILMYQEVLKLIPEKREKFEELEKQFNVILRICQQKSKVNQQQGWAVENISSSLLSEYNKTREKIIYPGIENLSQPFKSEDNLVKIIQIYPQMKIAPSKDKPKKIQVECSDSSIKYLLLKNEVQDSKSSGDTRREQRIILMLQFFNTLLEPLQLKYPLFASMSLNQLSQVIEWVTQTTTCREAIGVSTAGAKNRQIYNQTEWKQLNEQEPKLNNYFFSQYQDPYIWYDAQQGFIKSMALWSAFQYLIGFGDRHCDNILIHESGELIHIDYECVFHKGKFLPVPEIVDFRLTKNLRYGMGYLREQGQFRQILEQIIEVFQKHKDIIFAFLDPYIYDPLLCRTSSDVIELIKYKLNNQINVQNLIERNCDSEILRQMYYGWAPYQ